MASSAIGRPPGVQLTGPAKLAEVTALIQRLRIDLNERRLSPTERETALSRLKVLGRQVQNSDPIFTKEGIETLTRHGLEGKVEPASREALRCLANALVLVPKTRQLFVDLDYAAIASKRLGNENQDDEFLLSRVLFLTTYETTLNFDHLCDGHNLVENINANIARHSQHSSKDARKSSGTSIDDMALSETLKLLFNITHFYPDRAAAFSESIPHILTLLARRKDQDPPLQQPVNYLINSLINLKLEEVKPKNANSNPLFPIKDPKFNAGTLIGILDRAVTLYPEEEVDQLAAPLVTLLRKIYELSPEMVQTFMQLLILPSDDERNKPLGKSNTLSSRLLQLSTSPMTPTLRDNLSSLFFELSGKDAENFVDNIGYGFASGFLMTHNLQNPTSVTQSRSESEDRRRTEARKTRRHTAFPINPVTGQKVSAEAVVEDQPEMTEAEKQREAEKLFVLFERLKKTGVMDVINPVQKAVQEGRFEELD